MVGRETRWRAWVTATAAVLVAMIGWAGYLSGTQISFMEFYLLPIIAVGWRAGRWPAITVAGMAGLAWYGANTNWRLGTESATSIWNGFNRAVIFLSVGILSDLLTRQTRLARTDALTGLPNLRALYERMEAVLPPRRRRTGPLCLASIDIDNFKRVNDQFGHVAGDELLRSVANVIRESIRAGDLAARTGGDEFAVLFWRVRPEAVEGIAQRLVERIAELGKGYSGAQVGASVGVAYFEEPPERVEELMRQADGALYKAKAAGKLQHVFWSCDGPSSPGPMPR